MPRSSHPAPETADRAEADAGGGVEHHVADLIREFRTSRNGACSLSATNVT